MLFDLILLSVIVVAAYLGPMLLRRLPPGHRTYAYMVLGDLALGIVAFASRKSEGDNPTSNLLGFVAIGGAVFLIMVPPALRDLARRALVTDRLRIARLLVELRELLQPGMGARQERELIDTILAVRSGEVDTAVKLLQDRRKKLDDPLARRQIDERIVMTYLYARRWPDAIGHFEGSFDGLVGSTSPQLMVEMVRAYCEAGELARAAELVERIESSPLAKEPVLAFLLNRGRLVFIAFVGRTTAVEAIVAPGGPLGAMPDSARCFWSGVARLHAGDRTGARSSLQEARRLSGRDPRAKELAERTLDRIDEPGVAGPHSIPPMVAELADRLTTLASSTRPPARVKPAPKLSGIAIRKVPVTVSLIAANVAVAVAVYAIFGSSSDLGALVRAGANVKAATRAGEWWRIGTCMFLHVGLVHLGLNMYGLWILGKLVEQFHGSWRLFVIYMLAGLGGGLASTFLGGPATSAGASGAVFGLLGALIAELGLHRKRYPKSWSGALLWNLLFLTAANVAIGFAYPIIDQAAHIGGMVTGALVAVGLSRQTPFGERAPLKATVALLSVLSAAALGYSFFGVATTDYGDTLQRYPLAHRVVGGLRVTVPGAWERASDNELYDPSVVSILQLQRLDAPDAPLDETLAAKLRAEHYGGARQAGFDEARPAKRHLMKLPKPWVSDELQVSADGVGGTQRYRAVVFARRAGDELWLGTFYHPAALAGDFEPVLDKVLESATPTQ